MQEQLTKEQFENKKESALDNLHAALEALQNAYTAVSNAKCDLRGVSAGYNITSNMEAHVLNYIMNSHDSLYDKVEKYIEELNELEYGDE